MTGIGKNSDQRRQQQQSTSDKKQSAESIKQQQSSGKFVIIYIVNCNYLHCKLLQKTHHSHIYRQLLQSAAIGIISSDNDRNWQEQRSATTTAAVDQ